jgi:aspartyl aminopeptidase
VHPNYPDKHDPVVQPVLGSGPILKINANQRYATDAVGAAAWHGWCDAAGVLSQEFVSNNAVPCGSTIGPITATRLGIRTVDVGIPILSMHSARELAGTADLFALTRVAGAFFSS